MLFLHPLLCFSCIVYFLFSYSFIHVCKARTNQTPSDMTNMFGAQEPAIYITGTTESHEVACDWTTEGFHPRCDHQLLLLYQIWDLLSQTAI